MTEGTEEMTQNPMTMDAGRALDAVIAEKVFDHWGVEMYEGELVHGEHNMNGWPCKTPHYSTDLTATVRVIERMRDVLPVGRKTLRLVSYEYGRTYATFNADPDSDDYAEANGEHALPLAICRAALAAMEVQS